MSLGVVLESTGQFFAVLAFCVTTQGPAGEQQTCAADVLENVTFETEQACELFRPVGMRMAERQLRELSGTPVIDGIDFRCLPYPAY